jgi:hypothetical protein
MPGRQLPPRAAVINGWAVMRRRPRVPGRRRPGSVVAVRGGGRPGWMAGPLACRVPKTLPSSLTLHLMAAQVAVMRPDGDYGSCPSFEARQAPGLWTSAGRLLWRW